MYLQHTRNLPIYSVEAPIDLYVHTVARAESISNLGSFLQWSGARNVDSGSTLNIARKRLRQALFDLFLRVVTPNHDLALPVVVLSRVLRAAW